MPDEWEDIPAPRAAPPAPEGEWEDIPLEMPALTPGPAKNEALSRPGHDVYEEHKDVPEPSLTDKIASGLGEMAFRSSPAGGAYSLYQTATGVSPEDQAREHAGMMRSGLQGITRGHAGEVLESATPGSGEEYKKAAQENPGSEAIGAMAFPMPGMGKLKFLGKWAPAGRILGGAALGAGYGLAGTKDEGSPIQRALLGAGGGAVGSTIAEGLGAIVGKAGEKIRLANADQAAITTGKAEKTARRALGSVGGNTAAVIHQYETAAKIAGATGAHPYTPEQVTKAKALLADPEFQGLVRNAADNILGDGKLKGALQTSQNVLAAARAAQEPAAIEAAAEAAMAHPIKDQLMPRLSRYLKRAPVAIGGVLGGTAGAAAGSVVADRLGDVGTAAANAAKNPGMRRLQWRGTRALAGGAVQPARNLSLISNWLRLAQQGEGDKSGE